MFNEKDQMRMRNKGLVRTGKSSWYAGPAMRMREKKQLKSLKEILNIPSSTRRRSPPDSV